MSGCTAVDKTFSTCTITITYNKETHEGTLVVTGQNKGDKSPTTLLTSQVVVGGDGDVTPTGTFTAPLGRRITRQRWRADGQKLLTARRGSERMPSGRINST
jgi:hypothetical protein